VIRAIRNARLFRELLRIRKRVDAAKRLTEREQRRRHEVAGQARQESLHGPPLSELEVDMRYGAVEQERRQAG
jgi:hypothetical protein